ncbi:MAG: response regulator [Gammaproteobacteria bacterium]|nr:response regulator [Gammaproteobacteria bacterium]
MTNGVIQEDKVAAKQTSWWFAFLTTVIPGAVIPVGLALLFSNTISDWHWDYEPFHALVESVGSFAAVLLAVIIISMRRSENLSPSYIWVATTLMGMGLLDGFHAGVEPGEVFVWLHSLATFVGGVTFALVILPDRVSRIPGIRSVPYVVAFISVLVGILSLALPEKIPAMVVEGDFTDVAEFLNITGGVGFLVAWVFFAWSHKFHVRREERLLLANHCLLFGIAGLLFHFSELWDATWWLWHMLRLFAYLVILWFFIDVYLQNIRHISENENKLKIASGRLQAVLDNVVDGIITINKRGIIQSFNSAAEVVFGYNASEAIGKNVKFLMPKRYSDEHDGYITDYLTTREKKVIGLTRELTGQRKDGTIFPLELAVNELRISGEVIFTGIVRDISERKRIESMKNEFISTVSHELRTPLTSIRGSLDILNSGTAGNLPDLAAEMARIASNNTERLLLLINDILDIQKIESGKMAFKFQNVELMPLLDQVIQENEAYGKQFGVNFVIKQRLEAVRIYVDRDRLFQVFANLLSNAAKFSPEGDTVEISVARHHHDTLRVTVSDHGPGIPLEFQSRLFEKFTQQDSTDVRRKGGTGLGLNISKTIMEKLGGKIDFFSRQGVGTSFYIELPELIGVVSSQPENKPYRRVPDHQPCILIVEDDPDVAALLKRMLAERGFNTLIAYDAQQAYEILQRNPKQFRAITLDLILPGQDGISFLEKLRTEASTQQIPVVVVSVKADEARRELNGSAIGVVDWLQKPIDQARLIKAVKQAAGPGGMPSVLHVEDEGDVHTIVKSVINDVCELTWVKTIASAREKLESTDFDLVLLDIGMPDGSGLDLIDIIERRVFPPRVVIFSALDVSSEYADKVNAVLLKSRTSSQQLADTIKELIE